jgi:hypothetical protein
MEALFGRDLGHVTAHVGDAPATAGLAALGARAAASGSELAFSTPQPPREQVAHELAHVVQGEGSISWDTVGDWRSPAEIEARDVARRVGLGERSISISAAGGGIHLDRPEFPSPNPVADSPTPLNQPSYVAGQAPAGLGGPTAGVGENFYATGYRKAQLLDSAARIVKAGKSFDSVAKTVSTKSQEQKDHPLLTAAGTIKSFGDGMVALGQLIEGWTYKDFEQIEEWKRSSNSQDLEKAGKALQVVDILINSLRTIQEIKTLEDKKEDLEKKPSLETVEAWADSVGNTFDAASKIPIPGLPGFMADYYKGLLSAPKAYIGAFKTIMHGRYNKIDDEADQPLIGYHQYARGGDESTSWKGELSSVFVQAWFEPKLSDGGTLPAFMKSHRKAFGTDLYDMKQSQGVVMLVGAISTEVTGLENDRTKTSWVSLLNRYL